MLTTFYAKTTILLTTLTMAMVYVNNKPASPLQTVADMAGKESKSEYRTGVFTTTGAGFEPYVGQWPQTKGMHQNKALFRLKANKQLTLFFTGNKIIYQFKAPDQPNAFYSMSLQLSGSKAPSAVVQQQTGARFQYHRGGDSVLIAPLSHSVVYKNVYDGIDWKIFTKNGQTKYEFIVHPHADASQIKMTINHALQSRITHNGELVLESPFGSISEQKPVSFQQGKEVETAFELQDNEVSFSLGAYNPADTLVIDPTLLWATYYGGASDDAARSTQVDGSGNVYIAGTTKSAAGIASGGFDNSLSPGSTDAYLAKFNSNGVLQWATYYGSTGDEAGNSCAIDASDNVYLAGTTTTTSGIGSGGHQTTHGGQKDAFLVKFNSSGARQWATYYGGNENDEGNSCCTDASGNVYLGGNTSSTAGIATAGAHGPTGSTNTAFLVKFNSSGTRQWGSYYGYFFGSSSNTRINAVCTDASGNVYAAGSTSQSEAIAIASGGYDITFSGAGTDAFLVKFNTSGTRQWGTYYGSADGATDANACAADAAGNVYLLGSTRATSAMATTGSHQSAHAGSGSSNDALLVKFSNAGARLWATYYGGTAFDVGYALSVDNSDNVYLAG
ncbi:MAG: hypothetical protein EAY75_04970, partial [Bacteroidetes bacterium]